MGIIVLMLILFGIGVVIGNVMSSDQNERLRKEVVSLGSENRKLRSGLMKVVTGGNPVLEAQLTLEDLDKS
jgi:hypothetical protein